MKGRDVSEGLSREQMLVICLAEECAEVAERASKVLRFGRWSVESGHEMNNEQRLAAEVNDLYAVIEALCDEYGWSLEKSDYLVSRKRYKMSLFTKSEDGMEEAENE